MRNIIFRLFSLPAVREVASFCASFSCGKLFSKQKTADFRLSSFADPLEKTMFCCDCVKHWSQKGDRFMFSGCLYCIFCKWVKSCVFNSSRFRQATGAWSLCCSPQLPQLTSLSSGMTTGNTLLLLHRQKVACNTFLFPGGFMAKTSLKMRVVVAWLAVVVVVVVFAQRQPPCSLYKDFHSIELFCSSQCFSPLDGLTVQRPRHPHLKPDDVMSHRFAYGKDVLEPRL